MAAAGVAHVHVLYGKILFRIARARGYEQPDLGFGYTPYTRETRTRTSCPFIFIYHPPRSTVRATPNPSFVRFLAATKTRFVSYRRDDQRETDVTITITVLQAFR